MPRHLVPACLVAALVGVIGLLSLPAADAQAGRAPMGHFELDPDHTSAYFSVEHMGISRVFGRFNEVSGEVTLGHHPSLEVTIPVASIDTNVDKRDQMLRGPDFFDARQFSNMTFESKRCEVKGTRYIFTGDLTLHGRTHEIEIPLTYGGTATQAGKQKVGFGGQARLDRTKWGMNDMTDVVGKDVNLYLEFEAYAQ